jgi:penicillin-binding protein 1A
MVLGSSEVRLIDMTRAFASVGARGNAVVPYGVRRVVGADGRLLYTHPASEPRPLVAPWVAAGMTDLLQTAVLGGTGSAAQIGRPVAGKTGTTSSNKDGWFIGFSSGLTTGVWMGRDDARPVPGLQGGTAPARAFAVAMKKATAGRPVENFATSVPLPDWQFAPGDEGYATTLPDDAPMVDADGNPLGEPAPPEPLEPVSPDPQPGAPPPPPGQADPRRPSSPWLDEMGRSLESSPPDSAQPRAPVPQ